MVLPFFVKHCAAFCILRGKMHDKFPERRVSR